MRNRNFKNKKRSVIWIAVVSLLIGFCQAILVPQVANAGSLNFGTDGNGAAIGGTVSIAYNEKLEVATGAFNLEMWVKETAGRPAQYTAPLWSSSVQYFYHERATRISSFMWGLSFDGPNLFAAWRANQNYFYAAGNDQWPDAQTSNTKSAAQVYNTINDRAWHHIALSKTGVNGTLSMYLDGVRVLYVPNDTQTYSLLGGNVNIGGGKFTGQIGDVRLVKGQALYTGPSITVPTSQITTTSQGATASNVSLLLKAGGANCAIEDFSDNHFPVLINGATCVVEAPIPDPQSITFNALSNKSATDANFDVTATASSGLAVSFTSATSSICTVTTSGTVDILKGGTCTINADQSGGTSGATSYAAASQVIQSFTVNKVSQTISFDLSGIGSKNTQSSDFSISATGGASGVSVTFSSANAYCTVSGSTVHIVSVGTCVIAADQVGNDIYSAASQVTQSFVVNDFYSVTYALGTLGTGSVPTQTGKLTGETFTVASGSGLSREGFSFNGWKDASNNPYSYNSTFTVASTNVTLTAQWRQNSLFGISDSDLSTASTLAFTTGGNLNRTISFDDGISSATVRVPFNAFSKNVDVNVQALTDTNFAKNKVDASKSFPINLVVSWLASDGTVPTASTALTLTINNPSIKAGSTAYQIIGDDVTALGTATIDGQIVVSLTSDPVISVTNDIVSNNNTGGSGSNVVASAVKSVVTSIKASLFKPSLTVYSASPRFSLDTLTKSRLKSYAKKQTKNSSITCIGYIYPNTKSTKTTKLATAQATNVCKYLKTQNKTLKTIIEIKSAKTAPKAAPGARWITTSYRVDGVLVRAL
jgi:uncharacterized repeat protein (TIGR02543 family)